LIHFYKRKLNCSVHGRQVSSVPEQRKSFQGQTPATAGKYLNLLTTTYTVKMATNGAPDSWDDDMETNNVSNKLKDLNVEAPSFVPNVNASVFVPSWLPATPVDEATPAAAPAEEKVVHKPSPVTPSEEQTNMQVDDPSPVGNGPVDNWEDKADMSSSATTPDDDENSMEDDSGIKKSSRIKQKPKTVESVTTDKEHVNVVFIGHVDAGKSTIGGQMMYLTGMVDKRTLEKYEKEAKEKNRETWYLSWCMDTNSEEREKGKTVEVGRAYFETEKKHFTILDAPGHKSFVPNMIGGASQADLAVLVISARKGEFETGFERGGQTREHAMLVKTAGVKHLVVLINKMDDPTVKWDVKRYDYCKEQLTPYLKRVGFNPSKDLHFMPCSGLTGAGLMVPVGSDAPWYTGLSFIPYIDSLPTLKRHVDGPFMMPIVDKYSEMGTVVIGKVESGGCKKGDVLLVMPNRTEVKVDQLWSDDIEVTGVTSGENIKAKVKGIEETDVTPGFVLCCPTNPIKTGRVFDAQVVMLDLKSIICAGYSCILHLQAMAEEVTIRALICLMDKKTGEKSKTRPRFIKQDQIAIARFVSNHSICMETFKDHPQLGRFTLRDEGTTIAIGKILKVVE
jgi:peptide chain release factor subunit 3